MKRTVISLISVFLVCASAYGQKTPGKVSFGVEWGYCAGIYNAHSFVYYDELGSMMADKDKGFQYNPNAYVLADIGFNLTQKAQVAIQCGYEGISRDNDIIPVRLKFSYIPEGLNADGAVLFVAGGAGFHPDRRALGTSVSWLAGGGYHIYAGGRTGIEITASIRATYDSPVVRDKWSGQVISPSKILQDNALFVSANIGAAVFF
ncbi:MAG: hypothetical protein MJY50_06355 [Bacteroidales bacterium]|nr:hypothetical protein [Bacteroidales bacterium]